MVYTFENFLNDMYKLEQNIDSNTNIVDIYNHYNKNGGLMTYLINANIKNLISNGYTFKYILSLNDPDNIILKTTFNKYIKKFYTGDYSLTDEMKKYLDEIEKFYIKNENEADNEEEEEDNEETEEEDEDEKEDEDDDNACKYSAYALYDLFSNYRYLIDDKNNYISKYISKYFNKITYQIGINNNALHDTSECTIVDPSIGHNYYFDRHLKLFVITNAFYAHKTYMYESSDDNLTKLSLTFKNILIIAKYENESYYIYKIYDWICYYNIDTNNIKYFRSSYINMSLFNNIPFNLNFKNKYRKAIDLHIFIAWMTVNKHYYIDIVMNIDRFKLNNAITDIYNNINVKIDTECMQKYLTAYTKFTANKIIDTFLSEILDIFQIVDEKHKTILNNELQLKNNSTDSLSEQILHTINAIKLNTEISTEISKWELTSKGNDINVYVEKYKSDYEFINYICYDRYTVTKRDLTIDDRTFEINKMIIEQQENE